MKYLVNNMNYIPIKLEDGTEVVHAHLTQMDAEGKAFPIQFEEEEARAMSLQVNGDEDAITAVEGLVVMTNPVEPETDHAGDLIYDQKEEQTA